MADHPFANAGLGNFGMEKTFSQKGMQGGGDFGLGGFLAAQIGLTPKDQTKKEKDANQIAGAVEPTQYEPQTDFPDILQQQYVTPYQPGYKPPAENNTQGFKAFNFVPVQSQTTASGYHPATDALWGNR